MLNAILSGTGIHVVIPAMMNVDHIRANVKAVADSRFSLAEIEQIRQVLAANTVPRPAQDDSLLQARAFGTASSQRP